MERLKRLRLEPIVHHITSIIFLNCLKLKYATIEPALGIELFILEANKVEDVSPVQEKLWEKQWWFG